MGGGHTGAFIILILFASSVCHGDEHTNDSTANPRRRETESQPSSPGGCNAFDLLFKNGPPQSLKELTTEMNRVGEMVETTVPFSEAPNASSLLRPRQVLGIASRPRSRSGPAEVEYGGRLFFGIGLECKRDTKKIEVGQVEFIAWNYSTKRFDFGMISHFGKPNAKASVVDRKQCTVCHKNEGPIFRGPPWANSAHGSAVPAALKASLQAFAPAAFSYERNPGDNAFREANGINLLGNNAEPFDGSVGHGAALARAQGLGQALASKVDRKTLFNLRMKMYLLSQYNRLPSLRYSEDANAQFESLVTEWRTKLGSLPLGDGAAVRSKSGRLSFPPDIDQLPLLESQDSVIAFNKSRSASNPFPGTVRPSEMHDAFSAEEFTTMMSGNDFSQGPPSTVFGDPRVEMGIEDNLSDAIGKITTKMAVTPSESELLKLSHGLIDQVLESKELARFRDSGILPERHELVPLFNSALNDLLASKYQIKASYSPNEISPALLGCVVGASKKNEAAAQPVHKKGACTQCHLGESAQLLFPFDPYNVKEREAWLMKTESEEAKVFLRKLKRWVFETQEMPPKDSEESKVFNLNSSENKALREFLDGGLGRKF